MGPPAKPIVAALTTTATPTAKAIIATARERREARARQRAEVAAATAAAAAAAAATEAVVAVTPPAADESVNMLPDDLLTPPLSFASTARIPSPPPIGPAWEKRHWRLLEGFVNMADAEPLAESRLTYLVSIDDPAALDDDPDALLADPGLTIATMETGEKALVLGAREIEAVRRFRERMESEGGEREQWDVQEVAAKVGALVLAAVRRRRRAEKSGKRTNGMREKARKKRAVEKGKEKAIEKCEENNAVEKVKEKAAGKGKEKAGERVKEIAGKGKGKVAEKMEEKVAEKEKGSVLGRTEMAALRAERRQRGTKLGSRLSHWL